MGGDGDGGDDEAVHGKEAGGVAAGIAKMITALLTTSVTFQGAIAAGNVFCFVFIKPFFLFS